MVFFGTTGSFPKLAHTTQFKREISAISRPIAILRLPIFFSFVSCVRLLGKCARGLEEHKNGIMKLQEASSLLSAIFTLFKECSNSILFFPALLTVQREMRLGIEGDNSEGCTINPVLVHVLAAPRLFVSTAAKAGSQTAVATGTSGRELSRGGFSSIASAGIPAH